MSSSNRYIFYLSFFALFLSFFFGCTEKSSKTLTVFAGAGLKEVFEDAASAFEGSHENVKIIFNFAGSPKLIAQLKEGAPGDILACPGEMHMESAIESSLIDRDCNKVFAKNKLVIIYSKENQEISDIYSLSLPGLKFDIAHQSVPVGDYTMKMLDAMEKSENFGKDLKEKILKNVVSREDNVKAVVNKVVLGEADAGVVYYSDVTDEVLEYVRVIEVPDEINPPVFFSIAPLKEGRNAETAGEFMDFLFSLEGQEIVGKHGFIPLNSSKGLDLK